VQWSAEFATGVERIDEQHKMLFKMSEDYRTSLDEGGGELVYATMLQVLDAYARGHFKYEEQCMEQCRCLAADINRAAHGRFVETLQDFRQRHERHGFSRADAVGLVDFLDQWLANHIARIDVQLKDYV
jgi:hemerythrin